MQLLRGGKPLQLRPSSPGGLANCRARRTRPARAVCFFGPSADPFRSLRESFRGAWGRGKDAAAQHGADQLAQGASSAEGRRVSDLVASYEQPPPAEQHGTGEHIAAAGELGAHAVQDLIAVFEAKAAEEAAAVRKAQRAGVLGVFAAAVEALAPLFEGPKPSSGQKPGIWGWFAAMGTAHHHRSEPEQQQQQEEAPAAQPAAVPVVAAAAPSAARRVEVEVLPSREAQRTEQERELQRQRRVELRSQLRSLAAEAQGLYSNHDLEIGSGAVLSQLLVPLSTHLAPLPASVSPSPLASAPHFQLWAMGQAMAVMVFVMASYRIRERGRTSTLRRVDDGGDGRPPALLAATAVEPSLPGQSDAKMERLARIERPLTTVKQRLPSVESRLASVEDRLASLGQRLASIEQRLAAL